ncbi:exodeoxyribonuclease VII large subunit [Paracoccus sp. p4-l81]|uniref:exodeoxyribonuclease VII large subunit n=1 Tax=Paracoccus sp. p4-l81 TaxID=3342806 RepID=UPI0035BACDE8
MDLFEAAERASNTPDFTVSELSGAVKRMIEGEFARVRVRGEIGRVSRPASGHVYFDLKDANAVLAAVSWKGHVARLSTRPEEGLEVIATGRLTTFPGQSKYQLIVDEIEPAGEGALMAMLEKRRKALAAEGLFDPARKRPIPFLPQVIGVITSPSGAVIRDILHRLRDRFPRRVLIWPVAVQGAACAPEVARAIRGFNALQPGGPIPRPDVLIVARGGGSLEDLWGFNEEIVVRAAADSTIPLISAVGHETDTTLIDHAADLRAPTPTAAAEKAVPVRADLAAWLAEQGLRMARGAQGAMRARRQRVTDLGRGLGRPGARVEVARQRFDLTAERLPVALTGLTQRRRADWQARAARLDPALRALTHRARLRWTAAALSPASLRAGLALKRARLGDHAARLDLARQRMLADETRRMAEARARLTQIAARLDQAPRARLTLLAERLMRLDRLRESLGPDQTLKRGFAIVQAGEHVVTGVDQARAAGAVTIRFADGQIGARITD